jgi:hypothetical protein
MCPNKENTAAPGMLLRIRTRIIFVIHWYLVLFSSMLCTEVLVQQTIVSNCNDVCCAAFVWGNVWYKEWM